MDFAYLLQTHRMSVEMSQEELAERAGISVSTVRDIEQRRSRRPHPRSTRALIAGLGLADEQAAVLLEAASDRDRPLPPNNRVGTSNFESGTSALELQVRILGTLSINRGDSPIRMDSGRQRALLCRLALTPNTAVARDELIEILWRQPTPPSVMNLLHSCVARARRVLEPRRPARARSDLILLVPGGYQLCVDENRLDLLRFRRLLTTAALPATAGPTTALDLVERALGLWRGEPLSDVPDLRGHPMLQPLIEEHLTATLLLARLAHAVGQPARGLPRLRELAGQHPLHEPLHGALVSALAAGGRQAEALSVYDGIRGRLDDEFGIDPSPELALVRQRVLRQEWPVATVLAQPRQHLVAPFQAPTPPTGFVGRATELDELDVLLAGASECSGAHRAAVCAITGTAGVGKTALALEAARQQRERFPDGQLFVDLRGLDSDSVEPVEALTRFLRALGVASDAVPTDLAECEGLFRSLLADRRVLVMLDNARDAAQVRPLLPGAGESAAVVTSRSRLAGLDSLPMINSEPLTTTEALEMLVTTLGTDRVEVEPAAAQRLVASCGGLPLALRIVAARLVSRPNLTLGSLAARLAVPGRRLDELQAGDLAITASLAASYRRLPTRPARAFRLLALLPEACFSTVTAATALALPSAEVRDDLDQLVEANLLDMTGTDHYRYQELLRIYAAGQAGCDGNRLPVPQSDARCDRLDRLDRLSRLG